MAKGFKTPEGPDDSSDDDTAFKQSKSFSVNTEHSAAEGNDTRNDANGRKRKHDEAGA